MKSVVTSVGLVSLLAACIVASGTASTGNTARGKTGGTLILGIPFEVASLDPLRENEETTTIVEGQVYDTLLHVNPTDPTRFLPGLATSWSATDHNQVFTFHLRHDARFSNGDPVTADDVVFSFNRLWNLQASPSFILAGMKSITAVDPYTVRITTAHPDAAWLSKMTFTMACVIDSKVAQAHGATSDANAAKTDTAEPFFNSGQTIGSGPFMLTQYVPNTDFVLEPNPYYWGPKPALSKVIVQNVPSSTTERQLLEKGSIDVAGSIDYDTAKQLSSEHGLQISYAPTLNLVYLFMTASSSVSRPVSNPLVHEAVAHAIDYRGLLQLANGEAQQPPTTIPLGLLGANTVPVPRQNLALARSLMKKAGYARGFSIPFAYPQDVKFNIDFGVVAAKLQSDLARIGIKLKLLPLTSTEFLNKFRTKRDPIGISFWSPDYVDPDDYVGPFWSTDVGFLTARLHYKNSAVDRLYRQSLATTNRAIRVELYGKMQKLFQANPVLIGLIQPKYILAASSRVQGLRYIWELREFDFSKVSVS